jgi:uncharacterized membrane protein YraQ (UPF0718 family)
MRRLHALGHALAISGSMTWEILWALILGFALSAVVQAAVRRSTIIRRLGDDRPKTLAFATGFGAASSSCSYAAVALARSLLVDHDADSPVAVWRRVFTIHVAYPCLVPLAVVRATTSVSSVAWNSASAAISRPLCKC